MSTRKPDPLELAFKKPYASDSCIAIGKVLADGYEHSQDEILKLTKLSEGEIVSGLINLEKRAKVVSSRPLITSDYVKKNQVIPIVYQFKRKYLERLQKNKNDYLLT
ncbi:MAG: hypothetical protein QW177_09725 [Candidatus Nitrosotenuis sp.]